MESQNKDTSLARTQRKWIGSSSGLVFLSLFMLAAIIYGFVITIDRNALYTRLQTVQRDFASKQAEFNTELQKSQDNLASTRAELSSTQQTLASTRAELNSTTQNLTSAQGELKKVEAELLLYKDTLGIQVFSGVQPPLRGAEPIELVNNSAATDSNWQQLISFLRTDPTDDRTWTKDIFVSGDFAEMLHNNAEAAGIRAAVVGVFFEGETIGHGLNAFKTTDRGLVYADSTGPTLEQKLQEIQLEWDKIAYMVKGKEFGSISLGQNTPLDYASYEKMKADWNSYYQKLEAYNRDVKAYNREIFGKVYYIGTTEWSRIKEWERTLKEQKKVLDSLRAQLEYLWKPMGIVKSIKIYW